MFFESLFANIQNLFISGYKTHPEAVIVSCYFNPTRSQPRLDAFNKFYESIKHLNHRIIECLIGDDTPQLPQSEFIQTVYSESLLWHKESLLNKLISELPKKFKYVFWIDADIKFTNLNWMVDSVKQLEHYCNILQPFEYCIHLDENQIEPNFNIDIAKLNINKHVQNRRMWRSFCANFCTTILSGLENYDIHGHVGFAWGARREVLDQIPLYDRALIGGADHIMAHAAAGQIPHECIKKSFTDDIEEVTKWMKEFYSVVHGRIRYVPGNVYHYWHGDIAKRQYLQRIKDFTKDSKKILKKDQNGLYIHPNDPYLKNYFATREVLTESVSDALEEIVELTTETLANSFVQNDIEANPYSSDSDNESNIVDEILSTDEYRGAGSDQFEDYPDNENFS